MADLLETAAIAGQRRAFDRREDFVVRERRLAGTGDEVVRSERAAFRSLPSAAARQFEDRVMRDQRRDAVGRRRRIDDVAADGRGFAQLIVGEPDRAARHRRHGAAERGVVEETLDRRRGAEADARVVHGALAQFGDARDIDQHRNMHVAGAALARPGQQIGGARDQPIAAAMRFHQMEGLVERGCRQIFVAEKHGVAILLRSSLPFRGGSASEASRGGVICESRPPPGSAALGHPLPQAGEG